MRLIEARLSLGNEGGLALLGELFNLIIYGPTARRVGRYFKELPLEMAPQTQS